MAAKEPLTEKCFKCGKKITDREWVVCWTSCEDCLNESLEEYERKRANGDRSNS